MEMAFGFYQVFHVVFVLLVQWFGASLSVGFIVESLPGLEGPLPFHLETGYVGVGEGDDAQLFYYFIKSQRNPKEDPLILWLTGGPRCSSFTALVKGIGPIYFKDWLGNDMVGNDDLPTIVLNPDSLTQVANVIFLDQPIGTGFSYSKSGQEGNISDTKSAHDSYKFLGKWFVDHPEFLSNPFYISGDSYSGIIIPLIVQELINGIEDGSEPLFNFKGYTLGNPVTCGPLEQNENVPYAHRMGLISDELYESLKLNCKGEYINFNSSNVLCSKDIESYAMCISDINREHILEPYCRTITHKQNVSEHSRHSYGSIKRIRDTCGSSELNLLPGVWLNKNRVRKALHVKKGTIKKWIECNFHEIPGEVDYGVPYEYEVKSTVEYHRYISTKGYRSLIYSGDHDMRVSHISTEAWIRSLGFFIVDDWHPWFIDGQVAGFTRTFSNNMTYATIKGAGHVTSKYKPRETFTMFKRWISNNSLQLILQSEF